MYTLESDSKYIYLDGTQQFKYPSLIVQTCKGVVWSFQ